MVSAELLLLVQVNICPTIKHQHSFKLYAASVTPNDEKMVMMKMMQTTGNRIPLVELFHWFPVKNGGKGKDCYIRKATFAVVMFKAKTHN